MTTYLLGFCLDFWHDIDYLVWFGLAECPRHMVPYYISGRNFVRASKRADDTGVCPLSKARNWPRYSGWEAAKWIKPNLVPQYNENWSESRYVTWGLTKVHVESCRSGLIGDWIMTVVPDILRKREKSGTCSHLGEECHPGLVSNCCWLCFQNMGRP